MKKVTPKQIQELYQFTRQHYVEHYDVQTELVDHLAKDIETIWQEHPNLSFYEARDKSFQKFGVFGFMNMYEERQKTLSKKYLKILWKNAKNWFQLPKILATVTLFMCLYTGLQTFGDNFAMLFLGIFLLYALTKQLLLSREVKKRQKINGKKWLLEDLIFKGTFSGNFGLLGVNLFNIINLTNPNTESYSSFWAIIYGVIFTLLIVFTYVCIVVLPPKAEELLNKQHPEYQLEKSYSKY